MLSDPAAQYPYTQSAHSPQRYPQTRQQQPPPHAAYPSQSPSSSSSASAWARTGVAPPPRPPTFQSSSSGIDALSSSLQRVQLGAREDERHWVGGFAVPKGAPVDRDKPLPPPPRPPEQQKQSAGRQYLASLSSSSGSGRPQQGTHSAPPAVHASQAHLPPATCHLPLPAYQRTSSQRPLPFPASISPPAQPAHQRTSSQPTLPATHSSSAATPPRPPQPSLYTAVSSPAHHSAPAVPQRPRPQEVHIHHHYYAPRPPSSHPSSPAPSRPPPGPAPAYPPTPTRPTHFVPPPATPRRPSPSSGPSTPSRPPLSLQTSIPPSSASSPSHNGEFHTSPSLPPAPTQCWGTTKKSRRCTRRVKDAAPVADWGAGVEGDVPRFCHQHSKDILGAKGFFCPRGQWVEFDDWIPESVSTRTQILLRVLMETTVSTEDKPGFIYCYSLRGLSTPALSYVKVGRTNNLNRRLDEWAKQCASRDPVLRDHFPGAGRAGSRMRATLQVGSADERCRFVNRLERLCHIELADLEQTAPTARQKCLDCGVEHKEIFAVPRLPDGSEYEVTVRPLIERWERFVAECL